MALANPCPESPIPWSEGGGEGGGRGRERKYEDRQFSNIAIFVLKIEMEGSPLYEQRIIESYTQDAF